MGVESVIDRMQDCIDVATKARAELPRGDAQLADDDVRRLQWLEAQLSARIVQVQGLMLDLEAGLSLANLGYQGAQEITELLEDVEAEIRQLQRMIREIKGLAR